MFGNFEGPRFDWVLGPTSRQLEDAVVSVQRSWTRISGSAVKAQRMVDVFYARLTNENVAVARMFANVSMEKQKAKLISALALVIENMQQPEQVVERLRELALRHVDRGVRLDYYNDAGCALVLAAKVLFACFLVRCFCELKILVLLLLQQEVDAENWSDRLEFEWRLAYTLTATTMMEATRRLYMKHGQLPPGLELLGGDGIFPPAFYKFNETFQRAVEEMWDGKDMAWAKLAEVYDDFETVATNLVKKRIVVCCF
jgi:hemoglobin-like flavoprotein